MAGAWFWLPVLVDERALAIEAIPASDLPNVIVVLADDLG
jgi:hypothetical protein